MGSFASEDDFRQLMAGQYGIWRAQQLEPDNSIYNIGEYFDIQGELDLDVFESALRQAVLEAESLRLRFTGDGASLRQHVAACDDWTFRVVDLVQEDDPEAAAEQWMRADMGRAADLRTDTLFTFALLRLGQDRVFWYQRCHHIVSDGFGGSIVSGRIAEIYNALLGKKDFGENALPPLSMLLDADASYRASADFSADRDYWNGVLASAPETVSVSGGRPSGTPRSLTRHMEVIPSGHSATLRTAARRLRTSLSGLTIVTAAAYMHRRTGAEDMVIGVPVLGRTGSAQRRIPAMTANILPVRLAVKPGMSMADLARHVTAQVREGLRHQRYRYEDMLRDLRIVGPQGLFSLVINTMPFDYDIRLGDCSVRARPLGGFHFNDLSISVYDRSADGTIEVAFDGNPELYSAAANAANAEHFRDALGWIAEASPDERLGRLPILNDAERDQVVTTWNATAHPVPATPLPALFAAQARRTPDGVAVQDTASVMTYAELDAASNRLARLLAGRGVGPESLVAVCQERSVDLVVTLLAVLKAGGAYLPIDTGYPVTRVADMLRDARPALMLTSRETRAELRGVSDRTGLGQLVVDDPAVTQKLRSLDGFALTDAERVGPLLPSHPAYVIYTSGSTGRPKGVVIPHSALVNYVVRCWEAYPDLKGTTLLHASVSFDAGVTSLYGALTCGGRVLLGALDGDLPGMLAGGRLTFLKATPSHLALMGALSEECSPVGQMMVGGEAAHREQLRQWAARHPGVSLVNHYGPTEVTVGCTDHPLDTALSATGEATGVTGAGVTVPIGRPMWNTRAYVLDSALQPAPVGSAGELYLSGAQLARGYLGRPGLTAERFVACPFAGPGERMYRTGDVARWNADGNLEYLGRADDQVKIRGFRIELGDVEAALLACQEVGQAVVVVREDTPGDQRLTAYAVPAADAAEVDLASVRKRVASALPNYMVPSALVVMDALPLTVNGKLDRAALPAPGLSTEVTYDEPRSAREELLCAVFAEVLGVPHVGVHDSFFELGGHSLLAVSLVERLRERGVPMDMRALFTTPTVADLAATAGRAEVAVPPNRIPVGAQVITPDMLPLVNLTVGEVAAVVGQVPGGAANVADVYPLAPLQEGIFFHHLMAAGRGNDVYVLPTVLRFDSRDRFDRFRLALQEVVDRHDILRTAFVWEGLPEPVQVVLRHAEIPVTEVDLGPDESGDGGVVDQLLAACPPTMDLRTAPLVRLYTVAESGTGQLYALLQVHHLIGDQMGLQVVLGEVRLVLDGRRDSLPAPLPFRDFVVQARLAVPRQEHEAYFAALLGDVTEPTAPYGVLDTLGDGSDVSQASLPLERELAVRVREQARKHGVSPATVFHVVWGRVTAALSGREDAVFGTVLFGRMHAGTGADRVPGLFINTLPVRLRTAAVGVADAVTRMRDQLADLVAHEHAPLALAQQASGLPAQSPLFTSLFNYRHTTGAERQVGAMLAGVEALYTRDYTNYPVTVWVDDSGSGFTVTAQTAAGIDPHALCGHLRTATEELVAALETAPGTPLRRIQILGAGERRRVVAEWNDTAADVPSATVPELFEAQAARTPDATAVLFEDVRLTYRELNERANRLARYLAARVAGPESLVAVAMERSADLVVALLAVLKAGAAYLPVDPGYPAERIEYVLDDARPAVTLTSGDVAGLERELSLLPGSNLADVPLAGSHPAYAIYTSGSTGRPKGVLVTQAGLVNRLAWMQANYHLAAADRVLQKTPFGFDVSVWEFFWPLIQGATLVVARPGGHQDPVYLAELIRRQHVTVAHFVPSMLRVFLAEPSAAACTGLRLVFASGEALPGDLAARFRAALPAALHNLYGPTEASIDVTAWDCTATTGTAAVVPIGRPVWNTATYVLDAALNPVAPGVPGELYLAGVQLARGYLNKPGLTAERFVANPFAPGDRMYRTGDVARWTSGGALEYLGRGDDQVKIRGFRIELGEVEAALLACPGVARAAVIVREDTPGDQRLTAYLVPAAGGMEVAEVRATVSGRLPEFMVPSATVVLDTLPLTVNGKLDRRGLPAPDAAPAAAFRAPRTAREEILCTAFAGILGVQRVGLDDNFFELGGHSLLATRLVSRVRSVLGTELPLRAVFEAPTVAGLAARLAAAEGSAKDERTPLLARNRPDTVPLSYAQQRLWFLHQVEGVTATYNMPAALRLSGALDVAALRAALTKVAERHESLRTTFAVVAGQPSQRVRGTGELDALLTVVDAAGLAAAEISAQVSAHARRPFDLSAELPLRATLLVTSPRESILILVVHHIAGDGWSMGLLARDVSVAYAAYRAGTAPRFDPLPAQYADYTLWQRELLGDEDDPASILAGQLSYWRQALAGAPQELALPYDHARPDISDHRGGHVGLHIDAGLHGRVAKLAAAEGVTVFMVLQAAVAVLLHALGAGTDIPVGTAVAGRTEQALEDLIGFFVNTLVLRTDLSGNPTFSELLQRIRDTDLAAFAHQDVPFERLVEELAPGRSLTRHPLFQVMLVLQNQASPVLELPGTSVDQLPAGHARAQFDLSFEFDEVPGQDGIRGAVTFAADLFEQATVEAIARRLIRVLDAVTAHPEATLSRIDVLEEAERRNVVADWNRTLKNVPPATLPELFEAQAARTPDAVAVVFEGTELTYTQLNARQPPGANAHQAGGRRRAIGGCRRAALGRSRRGAAGGPEGGRRVPAGRSGVSGGAGHVPAGGRAAGCGGDQPRCHSWVARDRRRPLCRDGRGRHGADAR
jgi:amino acid adenylation domain-containing protein